jgi:FkbM family methyltransferase
MFAHFSVEIGHGSGRHIVRVNESEHLFLPKACKRILVALIERTGYAHRLRHVYHKIVQPAKIVSMRVAGQVVQFWVPSQEMETDIAYFTEAEQLHNFLASVRDGDVVWDVGANQGVYSMFAGKKISASGQVLCFEPERKLQNVLKVNRFLNKLRKRVVIVPIALGNMSGKTVLYQSAVTMGTHSLVQRFDDYHSQDKPIQIQVSRADDFVRQLEVRPPNAIKIDVEGAEYAVCEGLSGLMAATPPRLIFLEVHPGPLSYFGRSVEDLRTLLTGYGYQIRDFGTRGTECYWMATRNEQSCELG